MKYIFILVLLISTQLLSSNEQNKQISIYGSVSHHVANSKILNNGNNFYVIDTKLMDNKVTYPKTMQLVFDPKKINIKINKNRLSKRYKLTGRILSPYWNNNLNFYTYEGFAIDSVEEVTEKIKAKTNNYTTKVKLLLKSHMSTPKQAKFKKIKQSYIKSVKIKADDKLVLNLKMNYNISRNPYIKFQYKNKDINSSVINLEYTDNNGLKKTYADEIKEKEKELYKKHFRKFKQYKKANTYKTKEKNIIKMFGNIILIEDGIKIQVPQVADNGGAVPISIKSNIDAKSVTLFSIGNSGELEYTCQWISTPYSIIDYALKIKMLHSYGIKVIIESKDGKLYVAEEYIYVANGEGS